MAQKPLSEIKVFYSDDNIYEGKIEIELKNIYCESLRFSSPRCYPNSICILNDNENKSISSVKIKIDPKCLEEYIEIPSGNTFKIIYIFSISDLYPHLKSGLYSVYFIYQGKIKNGKNQFIEYENPTLSDVAQIKIVR